MSKRCLGRNRESRRKWMNIIEICMYGVCKLRRLPTFPTVRLHPPLRCTGLSVLIISMTLHSTSFSQPSSTVHWTFGTDYKHDSILHIYLFFTKRKCHGSSLYSTIMPIMLVHISYTCMPWQCSKLCTFRYIVLCLGLHYIYENMRK